MAAPGSSRLPLMLVFSARPGDLQTVFREGRTGAYGFTREVTFFGDGMRTVKVSIRLVDGGFQEFDQDATILDKLQRLQAEGWAGKQLVDELLTDDWGAPPITVEVSGKDSAGQDVNIRISYN